MSGENAYFDYLTGRSRLALMYRRYWLYPRLCRHLRGKVLDVGCGIGDMVRYRPNTVGVDINPATVAFCTRLGLDAQVMERDRLPFGDDAFEGVVCDNVLEHIESPQPLLAETRRVLTSQGTLVAGVPGRRGYASDPDHKVFYDEAALESLLKGAGFDLVDMFWTPFRSAWLDARMRQYCVYGVFASTK